MEVKTRLNSVSDSSRRLLNSTGEATKNLTKKTFTDSLAFQPPTASTLPLPDDQLTVPLRVVPGRSVGL